MSSAALQANDLHVSLGGTEVLRGIDVALPAGRWSAIVGPNGAGKTTLLKALAGLVKARAGQARLDHLDLTRMDFATRARHLVYLPQSLPAAVHLRVFESVLVAARASQAEGPPADLHGIDRLLERLGIAARRAPHPGRTRLYSLVTHAMFGVGLYLSGKILSWMA